MSLRSPGTYQFLQRHGSLLLRLIIVAAVAIVLGLGSYLYVQNRKAHANEELAHAIRVFYAPTLPENQPTEPDMKFADEKARYSQAEKEFAAVAQKYSWLSQALLARYYLGLTKSQLGKTEEAIRELRALAEQEQDQSSFRSWNSFLQRVRRMWFWVLRRENRLAPLAQFALAGIYAQNGKRDEAEKLYRELADSPGEIVSRETALIDAGRALERAQAGRS